jgi:RNA polymerase sigma-70 factor (ECF subfamily)
MATLVMSFASFAEPAFEGIAIALWRKDPEIIGLLVARYHYRLLRYLVYLTSRREQAEDLVQETWLHVLERAGQYNDKLRFEPWLFSIARNLAIDDLRRRQRTTVHTSGVPHSEAALEIPAAELHSPFVAAARSEDASRIAVALGALEPIYREALLLRFQEDLSLDEICQVTGAPKSTISSRIQRGLSMLRPHLEDHTDGI